MKTLNVKYFAAMREAANKAEEWIETLAETPKELYNELRLRYSFALSVDLLKVAINEEFALWDQTLKTGDVIVFIPPVAGG